jgi:hypothetical protein
MGFLVLAIAPCDASATGARASVNDKIVIVIMRFIVSSSLVKGSCSYLQTGEGQYARQNCDEASNLEIAAFSASEVKIKWR